MERKVVVAMVQGAPRGTDVRANERRNLDLLDAAATSHPDFVVFDELSTTPYFPAIKKNDEYLRWAESIPGRYTELVSQKARKHGFSVVVPIFERTPEAYFNSAAVIGPDGGLLGGTLPNGDRVPRYAKVHIPRLQSEAGSADEKSYFLAGPGLAVFETPKAKIGVAICYDRRFPESLRSLTLGGAEMVFVPGNFRERSPQNVDLYFSEIRTRAIENHVFVVSCNKAGVESLDGVATTFLGRSCVAGPDGDIIGDIAPADKPAIIITQVDLGVIDESNQRLPLLDDRRPDTYSRLTI